MTFNGAVKQSDYLFEFMPPTTSYSIIRSLQNASNTNTFNLQSIVMSQNILWLV